MGCGRQAARSESTSRQTVDQFVGLGLLPLAALEFRLQPGDYLLERIELNLEESQFVPLAVRGEPGCPAGRRLPARPRALLRPIN